MPPTVYKVFLYLHIVFAGVSIGLLPVLLVLNKLRVKSAGSSGEYHYARALLALALLMGNVGGIGLLLTGAGLAGPRWFDFAGAPWLALKQVVYLAILGLVMGYIVPRGKAVRRAMAESFSRPVAEHGMPSDLAGRISGIVRVQLMIALLVLLNAFLGSWKPAL